MDGLNGISVVICCYNSKERLRITLEHLVMQSFCEAPVEVILVDNGSTDGTAEVARSFWRQLRGRYLLRIVLEEKPGLMNARRKGVFAALYDALVFCDDDNWLCPDYLDTVYRYFREYPEVGAIGGLGVIQAQTIPYWFDSFSRQYACFPQLDSKVLYGAGLSVRTKLLKHIFCITQMFYLNGRVGGRLLGGDDHELGYMILWSGYKTRYVPELKFGHYMPEQRLKIIYLKKLMVGAGYSAPFLWPYESSIPIRIYSIYKAYRLLMGFLKILLVEFSRGWRILLLRLYMHGVYSLETLKSLVENWSKILEVDNQIRASRDKYHLYDSNQKT